MDLTARDNVTIAKRRLNAFKKLHKSLDYSYTEDNLKLKWEYEKLVYELRVAQNKYYNVLRQNPIENDTTKFADWMWENQILESNSVQGKWYNQRDGHYIKDSCELYCLYFSEK